MTSWMPKRALRKPVMAPMAAPPAMPARIDDGHLQHHGQVESGAHEHGAHRAGHVLALRADVEHARLEGECHRDSGEDDGGRLDDGVGDVLGLGEHALEQRREGRDGVVARHGEQDRRHGESERDGDERSGDGALEDALEQALPGFGGLRRACGCGGCHAIHLLP